MCLLILYWTYFGHANDLFIYIFLIHVDVLLLFYIRESFYDDVECNA